MKSKVILSVLFCLVMLASKAQIKTLTKQQVAEDINSLKKILEENSSYIHLNGYDINKDLENYQQNLVEPIRLEDFALFLTRSIGKIGDRHASIRGGEIKDSLYLPIIFAPENHKVVALRKNADKELQLVSSRYPYLKSLDGIPTENFLQSILPKEISAPEKSYLTMAVRELRDIQKNYRILGKRLPQEIKITLSDASFAKDTILNLAPVGRKQTLRPWDDKFESEYILTKSADYNKPEIFDKLFNVRDKIAYIQLPAMVGKEDAPLLFEKLSLFMESIRDGCNSLIVDVRSNGGGTRDLIYELAKYLVAPDSIYVANVARQRAPLPLAEDFKEALHSRNLFSLSELDIHEQAKVSEYLKAFKPAYDLDDKKYSEYYFSLLHGGKSGKGSSYYNKPVYILANEKSFSAASVFVAMFKGTPNVTVVGTTTDGSSGNSERFELPNSAIRLKLSTMVSFQKDGKILDGYGTEPDIVIERDLDQILWKSDTQLEKLKALIISRR